MSLFGDESEVADTTPERMQEIADQMNEYNAELEKAGVMVSGDGLGPPSAARTLRYGEDGEGFVRIALVENEQRLRQAARNVRRWFQSMGVNASAA